MNQIIHVWTTKYALTKGIEDFDAEICADISQNMISRIDSKWGEYYHGEGREWHRTKEAAITRANEMKQSKIISLKRQIEKLEKLEF